MTDPQVPGGLPPGVDPSMLPDGHPLKQFAVSMGVPTQVGAQAPGVPQAAPQAAYPAGNPPEPQIHPQLIQQDPALRVDPLSRPYTLPSGGLAYGDHDGVVLVAPMRGEQEEMVTGAGSGLSATPVLRHVVEQCVNLKGIKYEDLVLEDWSALLLHVMAMSMGTDMIPLYPVCTTPNCNEQFDGSRALGKVPCRVLRRSMPGDARSWPPDTTSDQDEDLNILREMGLVDGEASAEQVYSCNHLEQLVTVTLSNEQRIGWRYLRLKDLILAEEFAGRSHSTGAASTGSKLNAFINARYIATIDGRNVGVLEAMRWAKQAPVPLLVEFRQHVERRSFGYELSPTFRCPKGHSFRQQLPLNGAMFRNRASAAIH